MLEWCRCYQPFNGVDLVVRVPLFLQYLFGFTVHRAGELSHGRSTLALSDHLLNKIRWTLVVVLTELEQVNHWLRLPLGHVSDHARRLTLLNRS